MRRTFVGKNRDLSDIQ